MTLPGDLPSLSRTQALSILEAWSTSTVKCVLVPHGQQIDVELRNVEGKAFLRKTAPNRPSATNEAAVLRLFLDEERRSLRADRGLKPFVLVADADAEGRDSLADFLRGFRMRVLAVGLGSEGFRFAHDLTPDLILLNHRLPDRSAIDLCSELRAHPITAAIPIILVTDSSEPAAEGDRQGPDVVLVKPCGFDTILDTSRLLLRGVPVDESEGAQAR